MSHHLIGPSSLPRSLQCPGSLFGPDLIEETSEAAREGTSCHDLLELCITAEVNPYDMVGLTVKDEKYPVTVDMASGVELCIDTMHAVCDEFNIPRPRIRSEVKMVHPQIPHEMHGGTADIQIPGDTTLVIIDFKYGFRQVFGDSEQLTAYSLMSLAVLNRNPPIDRVVQIIVQPRAETKVSRHEPGMDELVALQGKISALADYIVANKAMLKVGPPDGSLNAGPHCKYCKRREGCPARAAMMGELVEMATFENPNATGTFLAVSPTQIDTATLMFWEDRAEVVTEFLTDVRRKLLERAEAGQEIPGRKLVAKYGNRQWKETDDLMKKRLPRLKLGVAAKDITEVSLMSVAQVEKVIKTTGKFKEVKKIWEEQYTSPLTGVKLVDVKATGEAIRPETAVELISRMKADGNE